MATLTRNSTLACNNFFLDRSSVNNLFYIKNLFILRAMAGPIFTVFATTYRNITSNPTAQVYGELHSEGSILAWPSSVTSISVTDLPPLSSILPVTKTLFDSAGTSIGTAVYGQLYDGAASVSWPPTATGVITVQPATTTPNAPSSTTQTTTVLSSSSVAAGTTSPTSRTAAASSSKAPTSTAVSSPSKLSHSSGISTGAIAGIAVGCAVVGLAIGLIAAICLLNRKRKRRSSVDHVIVHHESKADASGKGTPVHDTRLSQFLLEATPDRDIIQETQSIGALIDQHVGSYYHLQPIKIDERALASALHHLGFPSLGGSASLDAQGAAALCLDPKNRRTGLRHVIMRVLFRSIDVHTSQGLSMLPAPAASFLRAVPPAENDRFGDHEANALALREWRKLSAFLLHPARSQRTTLPAGDAAVARQAEELANSLNSFLHVFVDQQHQHQQVGHLQAVIEEGAKLGYMLFSHPSDWEFIYEAGTAADTREVVVEAGLCKLGGQPSPQRLLDPVVVSYSDSRR
ncbi:hypothetical protein PWT90_02614 [Aphanocladium album]|nr:hypothetical protein PWT90_02614 [Aphanocladium album]